MAMLEIDDTNAPELIPKEQRMDGETFETFVSRERDRLNNRLEEIAAEERKLAEERGSIERELAGISAYIAAKEGRLDVSGRKPARSPRRSGGQRAPRGERRGAILDLIKQHAEGLSRGELIELLDVKGDKSGEQSVSNALSALKKADHIASRDGKYVAA